MFSAVSSCFVLMRSGSSSAFCSFRRLSALSGLPAERESAGVTALRIGTRVLLAAAGFLFIKPGLMTDALALSLIALELPAARLLNRAAA